MKEYYFYLDNTPTHSYMNYLYKYPHQAFPYKALVETNRSIGREAPEFELLDTGVFANNRYFDVLIEYAKGSHEDILIRITVTNRGPEDAILHLLPTLWFRNTWSWDQSEARPSMRVSRFNSTFSVVEASHPTLHNRWLYCESAKELLFTENETNRQKLYGVRNASKYVKDGINDFVVHGKKHCVNPALIGTKMSVHYVLKIGAVDSRIIHLRLTDSSSLRAPFNRSFAKTFQKRKREADEFYKRISPFSVNDDESTVQRQAFAGMLWTKQFYHYIVEDWLNGDPVGPPPPESHKTGRNHEWEHLYNEDILSMPDKWEYPWFAAWDTAFHTLPLAMIDPEFAKNQLILLTREWYMHPNGQIPAYEWKFSDVNPPVHAWAALRVYKIEKKMYGRADTRFLERVFQKLLLNFTWWVNRKDAEGRNIFQGGFLGLDNIGVFDRSAELPTGGHIEQADGTSWMAMYCLNMLAISLELAQINPSYEDIASKFFEHFLYIADAINRIGHDGANLWDENDGFYYDVLHLPDDRHLPLKVRSMVGLIPLFAVATVDQDVLDSLPGFKKRMDWFIYNRPDLSKNVACMVTTGACHRRLLSIVSPKKLQRVLKKMLDESEFLSPYGIRAISRYHADHPYIFEVNGQQHRVDYEPAESSSGLFGGNSNWRGPIWFPVNYLLIESLQKFHHYLGNDFHIECPTGSGKHLTLWEVASVLSDRLIQIFLRDAHRGDRPVFGNTQTFQRDPYWRDYILFFEYFHGDNGAGIGASHQTGWTGLVAKLIHQTNKYG